MRTNLKLLRVKNYYTQKEMAVRLGCSRPTYSMIERGERSGNSDFWRAVQVAFGVPDSEMYKLMKLDEREK